MTALRGSSIITAVAVLAAVGIARRRQYAGVPPALRPAAR
jgi:hypothetical protein